MKHGKSVLITGANSGIGLACVHRFLEEGYKVFAQYHTSCENLLGIGVEEKPFCGDFIYRSCSKQFCDNLPNCSYGGSRPFNSSKGFSLYAGGKSGDNDYSHIGFFCDDEHCGHYSRFFTRFI